MKHSYISFILGSTLAVSALVVPFATFAQDRGDDRNSNDNRHISVDSKGNRDNNWFNSFDSWFTDHMWHRNNSSTTDNGVSRWNWNGNSTTSTTTTPPPSLPPVISGVTSPTTLDVRSTGTWTVNASDPQNGTLTYSVDWGDQNARYGFRSLFAVQPTFVQTATFTHVYNTPGTYTITFTVKDSVGLTSSTSVTVQVTANQNNLIISNIGATSTRPHNATISWTTNVRSNSEVWYSTTSPVSASGTPQMTDMTKTTSHRVSLRGLTANTTYYVVVGSKDSYNNLVIGAQISFVTPATTTTATTTSTTSPLVLSNVSEAVGSSTINFSWNTNNNANSNIFYSTSSPVIGGSLTHEISDGTETTSHSLAVSGLATSTTYYFAVQSVDVYNNIATSSEVSTTTLAI